MLPPRHATVPNNWTPRPARYEKTARRLERNWFPNEYKTAAMMQPGYRERQRASNARAAARETRALAQRHRQIAVDLRNAP